MSYLTAQGTVYVPEFVKNALNLSSGDGVMFLKTEDGVLMLSDEQFLARMGMTDDIEQKDPRPPLDNGARYLDEDAHADPVFIDKDFFFYFFNETWTDAHGPYSTRDEVENALTEYAKRL